MFYFLALFLCSHSNSCTLARPWASHRCLYTVVRCMGKLVPSAALPGTLIAPGTAPSAPDTFPLPKGRSKHMPDKYLSFIYPQECLLSSHASFEQRPAFVLMLAHIGTPGSYQLHLQCRSWNGLLKCISLASFRWPQTSTGLLSSSVDPKK